MANFNFTVDTHPMANSIDNVASHVDGTTAAVVAMQTAVVVAEEEGAKKICSNINLGFYSLIRSQISQKIAFHKSKADAKITELQQQTLSLSGIKNRMEKDYMLITSRYVKLFEELNKSLRARIFEIDRPLINFLFKHILPMGNRQKRLTGVPCTSPGEIVVGSQEISISNTRLNVKKHLYELSGFISDSENQKRLIGSILANEKVDQPYAIYIPIVITESTGILLKRPHWTITYPQIDENTQAAIESHIYSSLSSVRWEENASANSERVTREFFALVDQSSLPNRQKIQMHELYKKLPRNDSCSWDGV
jgi:hypothetical protein